MDLESFIISAILVLLLALSALFSGSETAFFSLNQLEKERLRRRSKGKIRSFISDILKSPEEILITILAGNMLANLLFASLMDRMVARFIGRQAWVYSILIGTALVIIFGEMTPKNIAIRHSLPFFKGISRPLFAVHVIFKPFRKIIKAVESGIVSVMTGGIGRKEPDLRNLITSTVKVGLKKGVIHLSELSILESFLEFREKTATDVMIPRTDLEGVEINTKMNIFLKGLPANASLLPVYREDIDHLVGYIRIMDVLPYRFGIIKEDAGLADITRPIYPVPERKNVLDLFREMRQEGREMAAVVDEYGGTAGIISFQNLVEDFLDFYYPTRAKGLITLAEGVYRIHGQYDLDDLEEMLGITFDTDGKTLAGLIIEKLDEIPDKGACLELSGYSFLILEVDKNKIVEVEVRKIT